MSNDVANKIGEKYAEFLKLYGDTHKGVHWPNEHDVLTRHQVMTELIRKSDVGSPVSLLDFGCGAGHYLDFLRNRKIEWIEYQGLDISKESIDLCRKKFPDVTFFQGNINEEANNLPHFDYVVMNGVFTVKWEIPKELMFDHAKATMKNVFNISKKGFAVNFLSSHVDWEREDLFHLEFDRLAAFLRKEVSRNFVFRQDYGLYEYTAYVYR